MKQDTGFLDLIYIIAKHKWLVIVVTTLFAIAAVIYTLVVPEYWKSGATLLPVTETNGIGSFSTNIMDVLGGGGILGTKKSELAKEFITIMQSRTFREGVLEKFELIPYFEVKGKSEEELREKALRLIAAKLVKISFDLESNLVVISVESKDKKLSKEIAEYYVSTLQQYLSTSKMSKGRMMREFMESQVKINEALVDSLAQEMRQFQKQNKAIALDQQTEALIGLYSESVASYYQSEIEYDLAKTQYSEGSPMLQDLKAKKDILGKKIKDLENQSSGLKPDYIINIDKIPDLSMRYAQLMLNFEIRKKVFELIYPQYELAKLDEVRDLPSFEVVDKPIIAGMRSKPKRAVTVVIITIAAFLLSSLMALVKENVFIRNHDKVSRIIQALGWQKSEQKNI